LAHGKLVFVLSVGERTEGSLRLPRCATTLCRIGALKLYVAQQNQKSRLDPLGLNFASARWKMSKLAALRQDIFWGAGLRFIPDGPPAQVRSAFLHRRNAKIHAICA
jgi:hypothetical protein